MSSPRRKQLREELRKKLGRTPTKKEYVTAKKTHRYVLDEEITPEDAEKIMEAVFADEIKVPLTLWQRIKRRLHL